MMIVFIFLVLLVQMKKPAMCIQFFKMESGIITREYLVKKALKLIPISWTIREIYFIDVFRRFIVKEQSIFLIMYILVLMMTLVFMEYMEVKYEKRKFIMQQIRLLSYGLRGKSLCFAGSN